ncbi:hypothetical protein SOVF_111370 [Spinacia oleracea]|nr:hypothetical protein SOVF_111370 [Spinacia oleracea]
MKFGKEYKQQMVAEWVEAYMDYNGLKRILREIRQSRAPKTPQTPLRVLQQRFSMYSPFRGSEIELRNQQSRGDIEDQVIKVSPLVGESNRTFYRTRLLFPSEEIGAEDEVNFFKKLDEELNKVNTFYRDKMDQVIKDAAELKKQMDAFIALRIKVQNPGTKESDPAVATKPLKATTQAQASSSSESETGGGKEISSLTNDGSDYLKVLNHVRINDTLQGPISVIRGILRDFKDKKLSFSKQELKQVEERLKTALTEFYQELRLLKNYSFMNLSAFAKIMKKYEKISAIRSIEFYICYYSRQDFPRGQAKCHEYGVYNAFYFIIAVIPYWIRCLQCVRRLVQERHSIHGYNAMKYLMAIVAVVIRTVYELKSGTPWLVMALITSAMAVAYNTYWDIVVDWGLLRRNSKNLFLRDRLLVSHKTVYYIAMVVNVLLRAAWLQLVLEFNVQVRACDDEQGSSSPMRYNEASKGHGARAQGSTLPLCRGSCAQWAKGQGRWHGAKPGEQPRVGSKHAAPQRPAKHPDASK